MASSKVMASTSPSNPDLPRQSSIHSFTFADLQTNQSKSFGSGNMDELFKNIDGDLEAFPAVVADDGGGGSGDGESLAARPESLTISTNAVNKTVDEVWKEIVAGSGGGSRETEMTLEDFLTKAGAVNEEDVRIPAMPQPMTGFAADSVMNAAQFQAPPLHIQSPQNEPGGYGSAGFGNEIDGRLVAVVAGGSAGGVGRGKRRTVEEPPMDKATQQKQRRMIKNRESAARSRERKQAYTVELESLVTQLEEENARLLREEAEQSRERFKQLMENLIPVVEKRRPLRVLRRVNSMCW